MTGVQTCALPIWNRRAAPSEPSDDLIARTLARVETKFNQTHAAPSSDTLREAAVWVQHLLHGQSKGGGDHISDDEWKEAIADLDAALEAKGR